MEKTFIEQTMFLCEHKAIREFAEHFISARKKNINQHWSVICERDEDLQSVRNQLFFEISKINPAIAGISMYTPDHLAENFSSTLACSQNSRLTAELPHFFKKPYLKINLQEQFIETVLNFHGFTGTDSASLSKQILSLLDVTWPEGMNFKDMIMDEQESKNSSNAENETALKQISTSYEYAKNTFKNFNRLQSFVNEYLLNKFIPHLKCNELKKEISLPKFINGNILWINSPEYTLHENHLNNDNLIRPGKFQKSTLNNFKKIIKEARNILGHDKDSLFFNSHTILKNIPEESGARPDTKKIGIKYYVADSRQSFFNLTRNILNIDDYFYLLGDLNISNFKEIRTDGGGDFSLSKKDIHEWAKMNDSFSDAEIIYPQIDILYESFIEKISLLHHLNEDFMHQLFLKQMEKEKIKIGEEHPVSKLPRALYFLESERQPDKLIVIGKPNTPNTSSFFTKILNNIISILKNKGIDIDQPADEIAQRCFWQNLVNQNFMVEFWLESADELDLFPQYLKTEQKIYTLGTPLAPVPVSHLSKRLLPESLYIKNWFKTFTWKKSENTLNISITEFERYVTCPLQFFIVDVLGIKKQNNETFKTDHMSIGSQMHKIAEDLITRLVTLFGNKCYAKEMPAIYDSILKELNNENNFLSVDKETWLVFFAKAIEKTNHEFVKELKHSFFEAVENIWVSIDKNKSYFECVQERETVKRTFLRFLQIEAQSIKENPDKYTGIVREFPMKFELNGIILSGKIDRIDQTHNGLHIIDYKTSKIPKTNKIMTLFPSDLKNKPESKLSVQGALYSLAWTKQNLEVIEEDSLQKIKSFSLYQLKNLDENKNPILKYEFSTALEKSDEHYTRLLHEYESYAHRLLQGDFYPDPLQKSTCQFCPVQNLCPKGNGIQDEQI